MRIHDNHKNVAALFMVASYLATCLWNGVRGLLPGISEGILEVIVANNDHFIKGQQCLACISGRFHGIHSPVDIIFVFLEPCPFLLFWSVWLSRSQLFALVFLNPSVSDLIILTFTFLLGSAFIFTAVLYLVVWSYHIIVGRKRKWYAIDEVDLTVQL